MSRRVKFRFLVDEDLDVGIVHFLKKSGQDVMAIPKGLKNGSVYRLTLHSRRILLTGDGDFTNSSLYPASKSKGIAVVRIHPAAPAFVIPSLQALLALSPKRLKGKLILVEPDGLRMF